MRAQIAGRWSGLESCLPLLALVLGVDEPDRSLGRIGRRHEFAQHVEDLLELVARIAVDANGVITLNTYDPRLRLTSRSVGGQSTAYTYDAAGQLSRITQPDASWVGYEYDDAQRHKAVLDNRGNRIDYTLDNAGKRTAEQVKDPGGALRRSLARSIDALGRVQQTTGRE